MAEFMRRFATGLDQYEFAEVRASDFKEFVDAAASLEDYVKGSGPSPAAPALDNDEAQAVTTLQNAGLVAKFPGIQPPAQTAAVAGPPPVQFPQATPQPATQQWQQSKPKEVQLGISTVTGQPVTLITEGQWGPWLKSGKNPFDPNKDLTANLPKKGGPSWDQVTLQIADALLTEKLQYLQKKAAG